MEQESLSLSRTLSLSVWRQTAMSLALSLLSEIQFIRRSWCLAHLRQYLRGLLGTDSMLGQSVAPHKLASRRGRHSDNLCPGPLRYGYLAK